ncbi:MAG: hypothetical protein WD402_07525 [Chloroflexota bacterium]
MVTRPFYGVLLAPTLVLAAYGGTHVSPDQLYRPLGVFTLVAAVAFALIGGATRRWHLASFFVALSLIGVIAVPVVYVVLAAGWLFLTWRSVMRRQGWDVTPPLTGPLNVFVGAWFGLATATALVVSLPADLPPEEPIAVASGPNVYLILLDGYPRADSLMDYFDFDNRPFLDALEDRGFEVAEHSQSTNIATIQTVPSMMQMRPLEELLAEEWDGSNAQHRRLWQLLNAAPALAGYRAAGYTTYSIVSPAPAVDWRTADHVLESPWLSVFEAHLVDKGLLRFILPLDAMRRATILDAFDYLEASAGASPRFVFAHIYSPHAPYLFAADGGPAKSCGYECQNHVGPPNPTLADRLIGQLRFINGRVIEALDRIIEVDPEATLIVFSDHGLRRDRADSDGWLRTLFASRGESFPDDVTTLEVLPALLR